MAELPFLDSFDHYDTSHATEKWTTVGGLGTITQTGRRGGYARYTAGDLMFCSKTFRTEYARLYVGCAQKNTASIELSCVRYGQTQIVLGMAPNGDGRLYTYSTIMTASQLPQSQSSVPTAAVVHNGIWYYFEFYGYFYTTATNTYLQWIMRVNEQQVGSGLFEYVGEKPPNNPAGFATVKINNTGVGGYIDDLYCSSTGFYGDVSIGVIYPNASGDYTMWTPVPSGASHANWQNTKERPPASPVPDDDTTYVMSSASGDIDLYQMDDIAPGLDIKAIQGLVSAKKERTGSGAYRQKYKSYGIEIDGMSDYPSEDNYRYSTDGYESSPATSGAWTSDEINQIQFGQERII